MKDFVNQIVTLDNIHQWEERDSVIKESVSQHSFKVSAICAYLLTKVEKKLFIKDAKWYSFKCNCLQYAILHDFDESILKRDISHEIKYNEFNGESIREELDCFVDNKMKELGLEFLFNGIMFQDVKTFVKLCDWIALYTFINRNERMGASTFSKERKYCIENIDSKESEVMEIIRCKFDVEFSSKLLIRELIC